MKLSYLSLALGFALSATVAAHADVIDVFDLSATMSNNNDTMDTMSGTVTIDVTTGSTESGSFSQYDAGGNLLDTYETITIQREIGSVFYETIFHDINSGSVESILLIPGQNLVGYEGGEICSLSQKCSGNWSSGNPGGAVQSGSLTLDTSGDPTPVAATPEPSSLALLGTGLLGVAGVARRRMLSA